MMSEHWPRGTLVTRLYEGDSFALSLIRLSGETRAHRSPSARPAFLTVRRLLYSNESFLSFSSAEFCSAYLTPKASLRAIALGASPRYYGLVRLLASLSRTRLRALRVRLAPKVPFELRSSVHSREASRVPLLNFPDTRSSYAPPRFNYPSRFDSLLLAS